MSDHSDEYASIVARVRLLKGEAESLLDLVRDAKHEIGNAHQMLVSLSTSIHDGKVPASEQELASELSTSTLLASQELSDLLTAIADRLQDPLNRSTTVIGEALDTRDLTRASNEVAATERLLEELNARFGMRSRALLQSLRATVGQLAVLDDVPDQL